MAATLICKSSIPSFCSSSGWMGWRPLAHRRRTRSSVSSPERVVRSMQVMARRSHAACHSFFTVRRATCDCARRSTALVLTRTSRTQSRFSGTPTFGSRGRPARCAIAPPGSETRCATRRISLCSTGIRRFPRDRLQMDSSLVRGHRMWRRVSPRQDAAKPRHRTTLAWFLDAPSGTESQQSLL